MARVKSGQLSRSDRAQRTRHRMLQSAHELFLTQGYTGTTMDQIAVHAQVAVQTLYYTFRTKGQLLCEVMEATAAGEDNSDPVARRRWFQDMLDAPAGPRVLAIAVEHGTDIFVRAAPLWPAVAAARNDPYVDRYWQKVAADRRASQARIVTRLADLAELRAGLNPDKATDIVVTLFGHDVFRSLVREAGWGVPEYKAWLLTTLNQQLLEQPNPRPVASRTTSEGARRSG